MLPHRPQIAARVGTYSFAGSICRRPILFPPPRPPPLPLFSRLWAGSARAWKRQGAPPLRWPPAGLRACPLPPMLPPAAPPWAAACNKLPCGSARRRFHSCTACTTSAPIAANHLSLAALPCWVWPAAQLEGGASGTSAAPRLRCRCRSSRRSSRLPQPPQGPATGAPPPLAALPSSHGRAPTPPWC